MCRRIKEYGSKDRTKKVVDKKVVRGGAIPTRYGFLVVGTLGSCLGDYAYVGMNDWVFGSRNGSKRGELTNNGGYWRSKNIGIQRNHRYGDWPRKYLYNNRFAGI